MKTNKRGIMITIVVLLIVPLFMVMTPGTTADQVYAADSATMPPGLVNIPADRPHGGSATQPGTWFAAEWESAWQGFTFAGDNTLNSSSRLLRPVAFDDVITNDGRSVVDYVYYLPGSAGNNNGKLFIFASASGTEHSLPFVVKGGVGGEIPAAAINSVTVPASGGINYYIFEFTVGDISTSYSFDTHGKGGANFSAGKETNLNNLVYSQYAIHSEVTVFSTLPTTQDVIGAGPNVWGSSINDVDHGQYLAYRVRIDNFGNAGELSIGDVFSGPDGNVDLPLYGGDGTELPGGTLSVVFGGADGTSAYVYIFNPNPITKAGYYKNTLTFMGESSEVAFNLCGIPVYLQYYLGNQDGTITGAGLITAPVYLGDFLSKADVNDIMAQFDKTAADYPMPVSADLAGAMYGFTVGPGFNQTGIIDNSGTFSVVSGADNVINILFQLTPQFEPPQPPFVDDPIIDPKPDPDPDPKPDPDPDPDKKPVPPGPNDPPSGNTGSPNNPGQPGPASPNAPANTGAGAGAGSSVQSADTPSAGSDNKDDGIEIEPNIVPEAPLISQIPLLAQAFEVGDLESWSVFNLILTGVSAVFFMLIITGWVIEATASGLSIRKPDGGNSGKSFGKIKLGLRIASIALMVPQGLSFALLEDWSFPMRIMNNTSWFHIAMFAAMAAIAIFTLSSIRLPRKSKQIS